MTALGSLATTALLGTERRPPEWPEVEEPLGDLLAKLPREQTEKALLQTAGVIGTCHLAGWQPPVMERGVEPVSLTESFQHDVSAALQQILSSILDDGPARLQAEAFQCLVASNRGLPFVLLPKALEVGRRSVALRPFLLPVLGKRGSWLAAQNETWGYAAGGGLDALDEDVWQHGGLDQRKLYLTTLRARDAAQARTLVTAALATEGARERTAIIECLSTSLSIDDQDLLEATLADKSKEARQAAARLLSALPDSRFMQRMIERVRPCLAMEKKFLRGTVVTLEPPLAFVADWKGDLIEEAKPKGHPLGERAWWLFQIVRSVPLAWWESHTSMSPANLIDWANKTDWKDALLQGWAAAQALQKRVEWAEAFLSSQIPAGSSLNQLDLLETLPLPLREKHFLRLFNAVDAKQGYAGSVLLDRFIASIPFSAAQLSIDFAKQLLRFLKQRINNGDVRHDWQLRASLIELACIVPTALFDDVASGWDITKAEAQPFAEAFARVGIVLDQRKQLHLKP